MLDEFPTENEIKQVVTDLNEDSCAGPDGFHGFFYNKYWNIIKNDLIQAVLYFCSGRDLSQS